jgi:hypothetical protein
VEERAFLDFLSCEGGLESCWMMGGRTYLVGDGAAFCVGFWKRRKLAVEKEAWAPFGKRGAEALEWW